MEARLCSLHPKGGVASRRRSFDGRVNLTAKSVSLEKRLFHHRCIHVLRHLSELLIPTLLKARIAPCEWRITTSAPHCCDDPHRPFMRRYCALDLRTPTQK